VSKRVNVEQKKKRSGKGTKKRNIWIAFLVSIVV